MTPLPSSLGGDGTALVVWRLDAARYAATWDSGEGAFRVGGRWNPRGQRVVYASLDPATAILEVAVHKTFRALDTAPHMLTSIAIDDLTSVGMIQPSDVPNANWLHPCPPSLGQQAFGKAALLRHRFVLVPSAVSTRSWNLIFDPLAAGGAFRQRTQERFALDTRLHPPIAEA